MKAINCTIILDDDDQIIGFIKSRNQSLKLPDDLIDKISSKFMWPMDLGLWRYKSASELRNIIGFDTRLTKMVMRYIRLLNGDQVKRTAKTRLFLVPPYID